MYCTKCGTQLDDSAAVCEKCGKRVPPELLAGLRAAAPAVVPDPALREGPSSEVEQPPTTARQEQPAADTAPQASEQPAALELRNAWAESAQEPTLPERAGDATGPVPAAEAGQAVAETSEASTQPETPPPAGEPAMSNPIEKPAPPSEVSEELSTLVEAPTPAKARRWGCGWAMTAGMLAGCALLIVAAVALVGVYQGMQERNRLNRAAASEHLQKGLQSFASQNYELAQAEFELTLELDPNNSEATAKLTETKAVLSRRPTPTSAVRHQTVALLYNEARELYNKADWTGMIAKLEQLRSLEPEYESQQVGQLLVEAYFKTGLTLRDENRMEEAVGYFDRALTLSPGDVAIREQKRLAALYITGIGYWKANWQGAIDSFTVLYQQNPNYKDTRQRLHDAYVALGDQLFVGRKWCSARDRYETALTIMVSDTAIAKRDDANVYCTLAPATAGTPAPKGTYVGSLVKIEDVHSQTAMMIRGTIYDAKGKPMAGVRVGLSAFDWSATPATTNEQGGFAFDGLGNPVVYTLSLPDLPFVPLAVKGEWSKLLWIEFRPQS
jgi:tetratricopeptide (TPR) repeat protein